MTPGAAQLVLDEATARQVVLVRAVETADERGAVLGESEIQQAERAVLERRGVPAGQTPDAAWYLPARARELLHLIERRQPGLLRLEQRDPWWDRLAVVLALLALAIGFGSDRIGNPRALDLLSLPLLGFVTWNLAVYLLLAVSLFMPARVRQAGPLDRLLHWLSSMPGWFSGPGAARLRQQVNLQFHQQWWRVAGGVEGQRIQQVLHLCAAAWAVGVILSIAWVGLAREYRVGWESTWLGIEGVHRLVNVVSLPGRMLLDVGSFSMDDLRRLHFRSGMEPGQGEARTWALLYIAFLFCLVVVPRIGLALISFWRARLGANRVHLALDDAYFARTMARVSPARILVSVLPHDARLGATVQAVLRQASGRGEASLRTAQDDSLRIDASPLAAGIDQSWIVADTLQQAQDALAQVAAGTPVLMLCGTELSPEAARSAALARGLPAQALALGECTACWALEQPLRDAIVQPLPPWKRPGAQRLMDGWAHQHGLQWAGSLHALAMVLARSAGDAEKVQGRWPGGKAREAAMTVLLLRLQQRLDGAHAQLLRLHAADVFMPAHAVMPAMPGLDAYMTKESAGAAGALAGAGAGALAGAKIDLLSGGLTLGAGAAVGALIGGVGAFGAARWWDLGGTVRLADGQLLTLAESLVQQYLAVIHAGRIAQAADGRLPDNWHSESVAAVALQADAFAAAWKPARKEEPAHERASEQALAECLRGSIAAALRGLHAGRPLSGLGEP